MTLTDELLNELLTLPIQDKIKLIKAISDELITIEEYSKITGIPARTIYSKFDTDMPGFRLCGYRLMYLW